VLTIPAPVLVIVTLLFPGLLAWSAAALAGALRKRGVRQTFFTW
jgi:hypothetical protein